MATAVIMPKFGMAQEEGTVIRWLKAEGDRVEKGETLLEVQTDKVDMEVEAPATGILHDIRVTADATVPVTTVIAMIVNDHELAASAASSSRKEATQRTRRLVESPPTTKRLDIKASPVAQRVAVEQGVDLAKLTGTGPGGRITKADVEQEVTQQGVANTGSQTDVRATPAARRLARERSINLASIPGTGPNQRVQAADVVEYVTQQLSAPAPLANDATASAGGIALPAGGHGPASIPLRGARKTIAQRLTQSWQSVPHIFLSTSVDMTKVEELRARLHTEALFGQARLTPTVILAKAVALALVLHPRLNAWLRMEGETLTLAEQTQINLGIAVALPDGLIVPVVHAAGPLGLAALAHHIHTLTGQARAGTLMPDDVAGGTFTISNLGMYPVDHFTAIINPPQVAILAVGRTQIQPLWDGAAFQPCPVLQMTLSADHRAVDGATAAAFLAEVKRLLEEPTRMLL